MTLEEERKTCLDRAAELVEKVKQEGRAMTDEEAKQYDADIARANEITETLDAQAKRSAQLAEAQKRAAEVRAAVVNPLKNGGTFGGKQNARDLSQFSLGRALRALTNHQNIDGIEKEVFDEGLKEARASGVSFSDNAFVIPAEALRAIASRGMESRATTVTGTSGSTVPVDVYPTIFEMYRNRQVLTKLGATVLDGLNGNVKINTQTAAGTNTVGVIAETAKATELDPTLNAITLTPHRIATYTQISRQLVLQSTPNIESFAMSNLIKSIMTAFQGAIFTGSASDAIKGIPNTTGVNVANVATANAPTWAEILSMIAPLAGVDFDIQRSGFALNSTVMTTLMSTLKSANNFEFIMSEFFNADGLKSLAGLKAAITNSVGGNIIFGSWESLFIGQWGGIGLIYDPYTQAKNGSVEVTAEIFADAQLGNPALFSVLSMAKAG